CFNDPGPLGTLGAKTPFAPQLPRPNRPLRRIVRGLHPFMAHKCPQGLTQLEDLPTGAFGLGDATALAHLQQALYLPSDGLHVGPETGVCQRAVPDPMPPVEHLAGLTSQALPNLRRASAARDPAV